jgi:hypothetical protein
MAVIYCFKYIFLLSNKQSHSSRATSIIQKDAITPTIQLRPAVGASAVKINYLELLLSQSLRRERAAQHPPATLTDFFLIYRPSKWSGTHCRCASCRWNKKKEFTTHATSSAALRSLQREREREKETVKPK